MTNASNVAALLPEAASRHGDRVALVEYRSGRPARVTFAELAARVRGLAGELRGRGIRTSDRVLIFVPMSIDLYVALLACFGLVFFGIALVTFTALVAILFWNSYGWQALGVLVLIYLLLCAGCLAYARNLVRNAPPMFEATLAEIDKDREILRR